MNLYNVREECYEDCKILHFVKMMRWSFFPLLVPISSGLKWKKKKARIDVYLCVIYILIMAFAWVLARKKRKKLTLSKCRKKATWETNTMINCALYGLQRRGRI